MRRIGSFHVLYAYADVSTGSVNFRLEDGAVFAGFTYDPAGTRPFADEVGLADGWYAYSNLDTK